MGGALRRYVSLGVTCIYYSLKKRYAANPTVSPIRPTIGTFLV